MQTSVICRRKTTFAVNALVNKTIFYAVNHLLLGKIEFFIQESVYRSAMRWSFLPTNYIYQHKFEYAIRHRSSV